MLWNLAEIAKSWNLVKIMKFSWSYETWLKWWNLIKIVKFGKNCEISQVHYILLPQTEVYFFLSTSVTWLGPPVVPSPAQSSVQERCWRRPWDTGRVSPARAGRLCRASAWCWPPTLAPWSSPRWRRDLAPGQVFLVFSAVRARCS